jgi:uncharacterized protein
MNRLSCCLLLLVTVRAHGQTTGATIAVDAHQHLMSAASAGIAPGRPVVPAERLIAAMDTAGIARALVHSIAYQFGNPNRPPVQDEYAKVKAENDWTAEQVAKYPQRLRAFCSVNPLKDYAIEEIARCARNPALAHGVKLHFGNSDVDLDKPEHVAQMKRFFAAANERRMAIAVHMHANVNLRRPYGAKQARVFIEELLPAAKDIPVQIAHLAGAGGYDDPATDEAVGVFVEAIRQKDPRVALVWFDMSAVILPDRSVDKKDLIARRIRELGPERVLYGTDIFAGTGDYRESMRAFHLVPLTAAEFRTIEGNVPPYMR